MNPDLDFPEWMEEILSVDQGERGRFALLFRIMSMPAPPAPVVADPMPREVRNDPGDPSPSELTRIARRQADSVESLERDYRKMIRKDRHDG